MICSISVQLHRPPEMAEMVSTLGHGATTFWWHSLGSHAPMLHAPQVFAAAAAAVHLAANCCCMAMVLLLAGNEDVDKVGETTKRKSLHWGTRHSEHQSAPPAQIFCGYQRHRWGSSNIISSSSSGNSDACAELCSFVF